VESNSFSQDEKVRLASLCRFEGIDASPETALDSITTLIAWFFKAPISVIKLTLQDRIIVKSLYGLEKAQIDHHAEWCANAIATDDVFCITDALECPLTKADPLVAGELGLRLCAAAPLRTRAGEVCFKVGMGWQELTALVIVTATALVFLWKLVRPRKLSFESQTHCGCSAGGLSGSKQSIVLHARKGERPKVFVKAG